MLDPGHSSGAKHNRGSLIGNEGDNNYKYCTILKKELKKYGFKVNLTRTKYEDPSLYKRGIKAKGYDLLLSEHSNAFNNPNVRGVEVWDDVQKPNKNLATAIAKNVSDAMNTNNRGVKYKKLKSGKNYFGVLRNSKAKSSMIVEKGFHNNTQDANNYVNNMDKVAKAEARAIANYFNAKPVKTPVFDLKYWVRRVKRGDFGNEPLRSKKLLKAGLTQAQIDKIQNKINQDYKKSGQANKFNVDYYANKVIRGDYSNEPFRSKKLHQDGLNDVQIQLIQDEVNRRYRK